MLYRQLLFALAVSIFLISYLSLDIIAISPSSSTTIFLVCSIIGEGCSGGALGIGVGDCLLMMQFSYFSTISPLFSAFNSSKTEKTAHIVENIQI